MRNKITVYGLLSKIYNENKDIPKKIEYDDIIWKYSNDAGDYYSERYQPFFGKNFNEMEAKVFLQSEVDIIQEDLQTVSEEQVLFNELSYENQQFILKQMRLLQPCKLKENK